MVFSSLVFIFAFLVVTLIAYFIVPKKFKIVVLFVMSLAFYGWGEPKFIVIMLISITTAYIFGFFIDKYRDTDKKKAKIFLALSLISNLLFLIFFKYINFFIDNLQAIPLLSGLEKITWVKLPVGISFYTFQIMSYSIDLYRRDAKVQKNIVHFGTYVTLFPQLIAGPIVRYKDIDDQLRERTETVDKFAEGAKRFVAGLAKKILLADACAAIVSYYHDMMGIETTTLGAWMLIIAYTFQIYFDFSGYSDMAIGLGKMIGFEFLENFDYPYISRSITEFWRRWHMSLSTWFKEYVYIPLGGNRKGLLKQYRNIAIVWLLTGFWHGASWNYVLWGVYFGVLLIIEKTFLLKLLEKAPRIISHIYALFFIIFGWLIFYFNDLSEGLSCLKAMFGIGVGTAASAVNIYDFVRYLPFFAICIIACTPVPKKIYYYLENRVRAFAYATPALMGGALLICIAYMVDSTFSPFLYYIF